MVQLVSCVNDMLKKRTKRDHEIRYKLKNGELITALVYLPAAERHKRRNLINFSRIPEPDVITDVPNPFIPSNVLLCRGLDISTLNPFECNLPRPSRNNVVQLSRES